LDQDEEALWRGLKNSARKAVRKAADDGVTVSRVGSLEELRDYYRFAAKCARRIGKQLFGFRDFETMWRHFRSNAVYETFVAEWKGQPVAGLSVWGFGSSVTELGAFTSEIAATEHLYGGDLIKWEVITWARSRGLKSFDLAGFNPAASDPKEVAIRQFKEKWGGRRLDYLLVSHR
jgi:lipid II:glycine glycyltransferase (peptidoglycan interpeptide bridge formation enzyme)